jgi:hypothetical protein
MGQIVKCNHCDFIDYKDGEPGTCPLCGSKTKKLELPFKDESIAVKVMDTNDRWVDSTIPFEKAEKAIDSIIGKSLDKVIVNDYTRHRVILMIKAYTWVLLKKHPQLWLDIHVLVTGITEILTLKIEGPKTSTN